MKRKYKIGIIVILQVLFLFGMIGIKHYTLSTGTPVLLKAAPVDPWDLFRGEYVSLEYDITWVRSQNLKRENYRRQDVYVVLEKGEKYWNAVGIYLNKPVLTGGQVFIKGEAGYFNESKDEHHVSYGIESYYVEEGQVRELERAKNIDAQVRVDMFGRAVIEKIMVP